MSTPDTRLHGDILVVDDDPYSRMWARRWLEPAGCTVREATNAKEALVQITRHPPDLILLDVLLPDMDGFEMTRRLRQDPRFATIPILLVTILDDLENKVRGLDAGANDFLTKLPEREELLARVHTHLRLKRNQEELLGERTKTSLLYRISRELAAELDLDTVLSQVIELTMAAVGASRGSIILLGEEGQILRCISSHEGHEVRISEVVSREVLQNGLAGWVIRQREGAILPDTEQDERWTTVGRSFRSARSALSVPLIHQERIAGVLTLTHEEVDRFDSAHLELVSSIASQAVVTLLNAHLFQVVEEERARLKAILSGTADAIIATDRDLHLTLVNPAAESRFGISSDEAVGQPLEAVLPYPPLVDAFREAQRGRDTVPTAEVLLPNGRTLFFGVSSIAAGPQSEGGWVAVMQDITHLKEINRLKNEFVSTVSHDLRGPLSTIHGYAEVLQKMLEGEGSEIAGQIRSHAKRTSDLVEELLDLGKIEAGVESVQEPCRLDELASEAVKAAAFQAASRQVELEESISPPSGPVRGNPIRLRQVLDNLIENALKFTPSGGRVIVRLWEEAGAIVAEVQDSGVGIPREALPRIFEKFYRVPDREKTAGSGLGLAIVKAIVEQHGGQVWVESEVGQGSTFGFSLPRSTPPPAP